MSRGELGKLAQTNFFDSSKNVKKLFNRGKYWLTGSKACTNPDTLKPRKNPVSGAYGILGMGCQAKEASKLQSTTQYYTLNADSYALFALTMNKPE
jgi:hypothetical protein